MTECARILTSDSGAGEPAWSGPPEGSSAMVECELYSLSTDAPEDVTAGAMPDISPYACFYGGSKSPVLKTGWLDKLSPQGWVPRNIGPPQNEVYLIYVRRHQPLS